MNKPTYTYSNVYYDLRKHVIINNCIMIMG